MTEIAPPIAGANRQARILLLADGLPAGGHERQTVELLKGLRRSGRFAVLLGVLDPGGELLPAAAAEVSAVLPIRRRARYDVSPVAALYALLRREAIDLVQATGWMSGWAALLAARACGIPVVYANLVDSPAHLDWRQRLGRACAVRADAAVANGNAPLAAYRLHGHPRVEVIPNGIDLDRFALSAPSVGGPTICMVANFNTRKDHIGVLRALALMRRTMADAELIFVGHDSGTLASVRRTVRDLDLEPAVRFVTDSIAPEASIASAHVGVLSSPSEGLSNAILEYMAAARPVVATACTGNAEVVVNGETGYLVPFGSAEHMAERLLAVLGDPARARAMGAAGRRRVEAHFTLMPMVSRHEALYDRILRRGVSPRADVSDP